MPNAPKGRQGKSIWAFVAFLVVGLIVAFSTLRSALNLVDLQQRPVTERPTSEQKKTVSPRIMQGEEELSANDSSNRKGTHAPTHGDDTLWMARSYDDQTHDNITKQLRAFPQCVALGSKFISSFEDYILRHYRITPGDRKYNKRRRLIYSCESNKKKLFCGGMGDRFRGMITTFFLALLSDRKFELYHPKPVPLQEYLQPNAVNWIPTAGDETGGGPAPVRAAMDKIPPNLLMMRLQNHKKFVQYLASSSETDIRAQSNSFGVDAFISRRNPLFQAKLDTFGLPPSCNITCYFGCLFKALFKPTAALQKAIDDVLGVSTGGSLSLAKPHIAVQIRMGGSWATGMRIKEPFRTHPDAVPHFFSLIDEVRGGRAVVNGVELAHLKGLKLFVASDSELLINKTIERFGIENVLRVSGDAFQHTDTLNLGEVRPEKYKDSGGPLVKEAYFLTLLNHILIGLSSHVVMAQSGFGDTAFWHSRTSASCIFVDMNNNRFAWQHHLQYNHNVVGGSATATRNRILDIQAKPTKFY